LRRALHPILQERGGSSEARWVWLPTFRCDKIEHEFKTINQATGFAHRHLPMPAGVPSSM
jgi:hypothetical protein